MSLKSVSMIAALSLGLTTVQAYAQGAGAGGPFPFRAAPTHSTGRPFVSDTGSAAYPVLTAEVTLPASPTEMNPANGREASLQSLVSLPSAFFEGTPAFVQAQVQRRYAEAVQRRTLVGR